MQYGNGIRVGVMAMVAVSAVLSVTACQPGDGGAGAVGAPSGAPSSAVSSPEGPGSGADPGASKAPGAGVSKAPGTGTSTAPGTGASTAPGTSASPDSGSSGAEVTTCPATSLRAAAYEAADRPPGTGIGAAVVEFTNVSGQPCVLLGHPSVAGAGNGSPQSNIPLSVTRTGTASPVRVAPGGKAWVKLTFVQVQGEGDGYCESGSESVAYPSLVVGLPGSGAHQVALEEGLFAECDDKVTVTPVSATKPN